MKIVNVPMINGLGKTKGCESAGLAILDSLEGIYSNENGKDVDFSDLDFDEIGVDVGDVEKSNKIIYDEALKFLKDKSKVFFMGGDHSVSYSLVKAFFKSVRDSGKEPCLIVFDAHADCMVPMEEPTHEEWLRKLIEEGFPVENILLVGVRNVWKDEREFLKEKGVKMIPMNNLLLDLHECCDVIMEFSNGKELYVSIDIDVVDPAFAPSVSYREPAGLTSREFIYLIHRLNKVGRLRVIDLVEINSEEDKVNNNLTVKLGAKILSEFL